MLRALKLLVITGNVLFILWIWYNGLDEGFSGPPLQIASYLALTLLLITNILLLEIKGK